MRIERIKLGEGISLPVKLMQVMNVASGEELTVLYSEAGMILMKPLSKEIEELAPTPPPPPEEGEEVIVLDRWRRYEEWKKKMDRELREEGDPE